MGPIVIPLYTRGAQLPEKDAQSYRTSEPTPGPEPSSAPLSSHSPPHLVTIPSQAWLVPVPSVLPSHSSLVPALAPLPVPRGLHTAAEQLC